MGYISFFPSVESISELSDLVYRSAWHLNYLHGYQFILYSKNKDISLNDITLPSGFSEEIKKNVDDFKSKIQIIYTENEKIQDNILNVAAVIKWREDDAKLNAFLKKHAKCTIYRTDSKIVRQEGSFYIQCAFDLLQNKETLIEDSKKKFSELYNNLGEFEKSWVLATGPSIEEYKNHDFTKCLTIACNSTVLDDELVSKCKPKILVFADPIFHFGVSEYAAAFRQIVVRRLILSDITIIVPFKYYALLLSIFPEYESRIIGVPLDKDIDFNSDINDVFSVKSTANILTLLLLPVASTFSNSVNILGCDGRSFDEDDYFWGHGSTVQINSKMQNIQDVHPGFFKIDYNEYYFEHCHTLECLMQCGEELGKTFIHHADSFIPALRDRNLKYKSELYCAKRHCLMIEPDGTGMSGHYVTWYNQVINELLKRGNKVRVLCNKKQDTSLYSTEANGVFTSHSWGISRGDWCYKKDFSEHPSFKGFFEELKVALKSYCNETSAEEVTLFIYYGSVQILYGLHQIKSELKKENIKINISLCLFHESVILNSTTLAPRLPPNARQILLEGLAQTDSYKIAAVTGRLKDNLYDRLEVLTSIMPNPIPSGTANTSQVQMKIQSQKIYRVVFPCALRDEKGGQLVKQFVQDITESNFDSSDFEFYVRPFDETNIDYVENVIWIKDDLSNDEYQALLQSADIIVIPYLAPQFTFRTSGIIVDAMYAQKPLVVIEGTWLSDVVKQYYTGLSIKPLSSLSILSAINVIKNNITILEKYSNVSFEKYREENNWNKLTEIMFDR